MDIFWISALAVRNCQASPPVTSDEVKVTEFVELCCCFLSVSDDYTLAEAWP